MQPSKQNRNTKVLGFKSKWHFNTSNFIFRGCRASDRLHFFNPKGSRGLSPYTASFDYNHYGSDIKKQKINKKIF